jgi:hypothetical protein
MRGLPTKSASIQNVCDDYHFCRLRSSFKWSLCIFFFNLLTPHVFNKTGYAIKHKDFHRRMKYVSGEYEPKKKNRIKVYIKRSIDIERPLEFMSLFNDTFQNNTGCVLKLDSCARASSDLHVDALAN